MVRNTETAFVPNLRGGDGTIEIRHILNKDELMGHASMYAHAIKNPFDEPLEIMALVINERGKEI